MASSYLEKVGIKSANVHFTTVVDVEPDQMRAKLEKLISFCKPRMIICNDEPSLITFGITNTLYQNRGSVYEWNGFPLMIMDDLAHINQIKHGRWMFGMDFAKLGRWYHDKQRRQPKFRYKVCKTIADLREACNFAKSCFILSKDIETFGSMLNCDGFSGLTSEGELRSFVIPLYNCFKPEQRHWSVEEEQTAWQILGEINACAAAKCLQNGGYDTAYYLAHHIPNDNYYLDTMHALHSIWPEAPKKLNVIASIFLDHYQFWKDEGKGDEHERKNNTRFKDEASLERYWRYNALDCYYTLCSIRFLLLLLHQFPWAKKNYCNEFSLQVGPALACTMRGMRVNQKRLAQKKKRLETTYEKHLAEFKVMCDDPDINPNSPPQISHFIFKVLGAKAPALRGKAAKKLQKGSVDESVLKLIAEEDPLYEIYIDKIGQIKKPRNNISKYCTKPLSEHGRFMYSLHAGATETSRFGGRKHQFWIGNNPQNIPLAMRDFVEVDPGYVFFEPDFSQSDAHFMAHESGDQNYIRTMMSGKDTHLVHCAFFFKQDYEDLYKRHKANDPIISAEPTGLRYVTKRIVHGKNYWMAGFTLYMNMRKKAVVAAAKALGFNDAHLWDLERRVKFCQMLLNAYDKMYPRLPKFAQEHLKKVAEDGNRWTNSFDYTRVFFGDLTRSQGAQREAIAHIGQGDTAGNINRCMREIFYSGLDDGKNCIQLTQTHDSMLFLLKEDRYHEYAKKILTIMEAPVMIDGHEVSIPADGKIGLNWGKGLLKYNAAVTLEQMQAQVRKLEIEHSDALRALDIEDEYLLIAA